jgi:hypothetical protein
MANESEDTLDERIQTIQRRAENFRELLKDGDEITVACQDGEMHVEETYRSKFERKHAKLFGRMLSIEAQMDAGLLPYFAGLILVGVVIIGLHSKWWDAALGEAACEYLQSWWFYAAAPIVVLYLARLGIGRWEKLVYRRNRRGLLELIGADQLDRDVLLVMLRDESDLDSVVHQLKLDAGSFPPIDQTDQAPR